MTIYDNAYITNFFRRLVTIPFEPGYYSRYIKIIKNELQLKNSETLLDIGCGTGRLSNICKNYIGIDCNKKFIEYANRRYKKNFFTMDASKLQFKDKSFDKTIILETLHHISNDACLKAIKEAKRVTKSLIIIAEPIVQSKKNILGKLLIANDIGKFVRTKDEYISLISPELRISKCIPFKVGVTERLLVKCVLNTIQ